MSEEQSLEGWAPEINGDMTLEKVIDLAFDYRGDTTIVKTDGTELVGYLFNRNAKAAAPFIQMFDQKGEGPHKLLYSDIATVAFTGRDTAAGKSWEAWVKRKGQEKTLEPKAKAPKIER